MGTLVLCPWHDDSVNKLCTSAHDLCLTHVLSVRDITYGGTTTYVVPTSYARDITIPSTGRDDMYYSLSDATTSFAAFLTFTPYQRLRSNGSDADCHRSARCSIVSRLSIRLIAGA